MNTKQERAKKNNPPEDFFDGKDLVIAKSIYNGDVQGIENLVKYKNYDVNSRGSVESDGRLQRWTLLGYAILIGEVKPAEKLLQLGADVNSVSFDGGAISSNIGQACSLKNKEMIDLLLQYKVNLNPPLDNSPIDELLIGNVNKSLIEKLLEHGANINHQDYIDGSTPIKTALNTYKFDYVHYFLDKGAAPLLLDTHGNSLAFLVQEEINEGRLSDYGLKEYTKLKERLINEFHVQYPLKRESRKGMEMAIARYENLSKENKELLGEKEAEMIKEDKENLEKGVNMVGKPLE